MIRKLALYLALVACFPSAPAIAQPSVAASPRWKPPVANLAALPATGNTIGDTRIALDTMVHYTWDGDSWETAASGGGAGNSFETISTPAGTSPVADSATDTLTLACSGGLTCTGDSSTDTLTLAMGTAATATALAANGANCSAGQFPLGVDASGAVESCTADDTGTDDQTATEVNYTPTTGTDWVDPDPTTAGGGLDALAARLTTEEAKADDDVPESGDFGAATDLDADGSVSANAVALGTDTTGNYVSSATASQGLTLTGTEGASLGLQDCAATEVLKRNAGDTAWECAADATGSGIGGSTGATDLAVIIANGTGGSTVQASAATLTTAGFLTIPSAQGIGFGSATSSDPALYRHDANTIKIVNGDNSALKNLLAASVSSSSGYFYGSSYSGTTANDSVFHSNNADLYFGSGVDLVWGSTAYPATYSYAGDLSIARDSAGVLRCADGSTGICSGFLTARSVEANTATSGTPNALTATESWKVLTNEGATAANYHTLPTAVAGYTFTFVVQDADGLRVTASTGDTIRIAATASSSGGYCESTTIGDVITLVAINATEYVATSVVGSGWSCALLFIFPVGLRRRLRMLAASNDNEEAKRWAA